MATMSAEQIARALGGKRSGRQWACRCPAHDDHNPSLLIFDGHTDVQFRCLAGAVRWRLSRSLASAASLGMEVKHRIQVFHIIQTTAEQRS